jgi:fatty acid desaturase
VDPRAEAMERLKAQRRFQRHAVTYAVVIAFFVAIWAITNRGGYFWPIWPALAGAIILGIEAWATFRQKPITDADIEREMKRHTGLDR